MTSGRHRTESQPGNMFGRVSMMFCAWQRSFSRHGDPSGGSAGSIFTLSHRPPDWRGPGWVPPAGLLGGLYGNVKQLAVAWPSPLDVMVLSGRSQNLPPVGSILATIWWASRNLPYESVESEVLA